VIFYSGWGFLALLFGAVGLFLPIVALDSNPSIDSGAVLATGALAAAILCWVIGKKLNHPDGAVRNRHSLMFVPLQWYAVPYGALAIFFIFASIEIRTENNHHRTSGAAASEARLTATVGKDNINLRAGPNANAAKLAQLPRGTKVRILQSFENGWVRITVDVMGDTGQPPSQDLSGYANGSLLTQVIADNAAPESLPAPPPLSDSSSSTPSDSEIISAINSTMNEADSNSLVTIKQKMSSIDLATCANDAETGCGTAQNGNGTYRGGPAWFGSRDLCVKSIKQRCQDTLDQYKSAIAGFQYRSQKYLLTVVRSNNYEGTMIAYVDFRTRGTDDIERDKITLQRKNGAWVVVAVEKASSQ
jgi:hypothetical protein